MKICACTDEISQELPVALEILAQEKIQYADLRGIWGQNVIDLTDGEAARAMQMIQASGIEVTALSTPVGKTPITGPFEPELARFERAVRLARIFNAPFLRVFSFYTDETDAQRFRPEALRRLAVLSDMAAAHGIALAHENEEGGFCAWRPGDCLAFQRALPNNFRTLFEPCSFTVMGIDPYREALPLLRDYIAYVHVRDTLWETTEYTVVGEGDVGWRQILADLKRHGFNGCLTLEPHLGWADPTRDGAGRIADFRRAVRALRNVLEQIEGAGASL